MEDIYLAAAEDDSKIKLPTISLITTFVLEYCDATSFEIIFVRNHKSQFHVMAPEKYCCSNITLLEKKDCPHIIQQCTLPAIKCSVGKKVISGLCGVLRNIIKVSADKSDSAALVNLLGHKGICLKACAEVSMWTKFCEVELPQVVDEILRDDAVKLESNKITIPLELMKLENQFRQPCVIANKGKRIQNAIKKSQAQQPSLISMTKDDPLQTLDELQHNYVEGLDFTLADLVLLPCVLLILNQWKAHLSCVRDKLTLVFRWIERLGAFKEVHTALLACSLPDISGLLEASKKINKLSLVHVPCPGDVPFIIRESKKKKFKSSSNELEGAIQTLSNHQFTLNTVAPCQDIKLPWNQFPEAVHPKDGELPADRLERKCEQLENLAQAVTAIATPTQTVVDFCSGGGHLGILIAYLLPDCEVILVENKEESIQRAQTRIKTLQLQNITIYQCNLDYFIGSFDVGVSLHACGVATDLVLNSCLHRSASFVLCPCCYGSIHNTHTVTYPRSEKFHQTQLSYKEYMCLGHNADCTQFNTAKAEKGKQCMVYIDSDRASLAVEHGYSVTLTTLQPAECSPKNNLLIGIKMC